MKRLLKYLFPVIAVLALWNCMSTSVSADTEDTAVMSFEETVCQSAISESQSELCLPRQISVASCQRIQSGMRRTVGSGRNNIEFTKSGKIINADIRYFVQKKSIIIHSSLIEPSHRLLYLGKLII